MNYKNAIDVLPEKLLLEIQKYASGTLLYIPNNKESKSWGEVSGYRSYLIKRNQMIVNRFQYGESINELSVRFCLSKETIKKVVYSKKNTSITKFQPITKSAIEYAEAGLLEEWIHTYLLFERKNQVFSNGLYQLQRYYIGPINMPISFFNRSSGPESNMKWVVNTEIFENKVLKWIHKLESNKDVPPLIINYGNSIFEVNCNNPLLEALKRMKIKSYPIIIWISSKEDYNRFNEKFAALLGID
ncbi:MAG: CD3324 family protein [Cellulosilyticaceae bacterium]